MWRLCPPALSRISRTCKNRKRPAQRVIVDDNEHDGGPAVQHDMPHVAPQLSDITSFERRRCFNRLADRVSECPLVGEETT
jgi:hypothetical protein